LAETLTIHGTSVALDGVAVLLRGPPGSGKSDLALRLIDDGARLVADDQTVLVRRGAALYAAAPAPIAGKLEVRGLGIVELDWVAEARLAMVIELVPSATLDRLPEPETVELLSTTLPVLRLDAATASAAAKVRLAVRLLHRDKMAPP
jgi:HPr kinase/phosphorylase